MKPKYGEVTPHRTKSPSLTIPVRTRSPIEAFQMLRQGHPIDQLGSYYESKSMLPTEFWMMDYTAKLHALAYIRADNAQRRDDIEAQLHELETNQIKQQHDAEEAARKANSQIAQGNNQPVQSSQGAVS